jgi:hypothetical protein
MEHQGAQWAHFANMTLGLWLITGVFALGYRSAALQVSDAVSGSLVIVLAILSLSHRPWFKSGRRRTRWSAWLLFPPLASGRPRPPSR